MKESIYTQIPWADVVDYESDGNSATMITKTGKRYKTDIPRFTRDTLIHYKRRAAQINQVEGKLLTKNR